jgi:hypothetical protein
MSAAGLVRECVATPAAWVYRTRDGLLAWGATFSDREQAEAEFAVQR